MFQVNNENNFLNELTFISFSNQIIQIQQPLLEPSNKLVMSTLENLAYAYAKHGNHDAAIAVSTVPCTRNAMKTILTFSVMINLFAYCIFLKTNRII